MPLSKGKSKKAFEHNVKAEMHAGKPQNQALAIAYSVKRKKKASGGSVQSGSRDMNLAEGGEAKKPSLQNIKDAEMRKRKGLGIDEALHQRNEMKKRKFAEGGSVSKSVPQQKRPMPDDVHGDSDEVRRNSGNKPSRHDNWLDRSTEAQAQSNNGRQVKRLKRPAMVPTNAFSTRLYDEEADLQRSAAPASPEEQPPREDDEEGPDRQGPRVPDMEDEHSTHRKPYAKGGEVEESDYDHPMHEAIKHPDHLSDDEKHLMDSEDPSEDEGDSNAHSRNEQGPNRQGPAHRKEAPHSPSSLMFHDDEENEDMDMELNPAHDKHSADDSEDQPDSPRDNDYYDDDGQADSIAAAIMSKRDRLHAAIDSGARDLDEAAKMAEGGEILEHRSKSSIKSHGSMDSDDSDQTDLSRNADEDANEEDQASWESLMKENYSESDGLDALDQPEDSNEKSDSEEEDSHDRHDRVSAIRARMKKKQFSQR